MNYMPFSTAPALFAGLSARILLDLFTRTEPAALRDHVLIGVWQGVALHYAFKNSALIPIAFGIAAKLLIELALVHDTIKCATTLLGVVLGFVCTDFLSQFLDEPIPEAERRRKKSYPPLPVPQRQRVVQFQPSIEREDISVDIPPHWASLQTSDITSVDSNSELIRHKQSMTPVEREVAALRARASLADSERRRYKEERKWADSQGNIARAAQMKWQVKRYTALMQSFHREADLKLIEGVLPFTTRQGIAGMDMYLYSFQRTFPRTRRAETDCYGLERILHAPPQRGKHHRAVGGGRHKAIPSSKSNRTAKACNPRIYAIGGSSVHSHQVK